MDSDSIKFSSEIWLIIFKYLPPKDLANFTKTSSRFRIIASDDTLWLHHCWNLISDECFALVLPAKEVNMSYKQYYSLLWKFCSDKPPVRSYDFNFESVNIGKETWTRMADIQFKQDFWKLALHFPAVAVQAYPDSQCDGYLNNIVCYKRNDIHYKKLHQDGPISTEIEKDLHNFALSPYACYHPLYDTNSEDFQPMHIRSQVIDAKNFIENELKIESPLINLMYLCDGEPIWKFGPDFNFKLELDTAGPDLNVFIISILVTRFLKWMMFSSVQKQTISIDKLYFPLNKIIHLAVNKFIEKRDSRAFCTLPGNIDDNLDVEGDEDNDGDDDEEDGNDGDDDDENGDDEDGDVDDDEEFNSDPEDEEEAENDNEESEGEHGSNVNIAEDDIQFSIADEFLDKPNIGDNFFNNARLDNEHDISNITWDPLMEEMDKIPAQLYYRELFKYIMTEVEHSDIANGNANFVKRLRATSDEFIANFLTRYVTICKDKLQRETLLEDISMHDIFNLFIFDHLSEACAPVKDRIVRWLFGEDFNVVTDGEINLAKDGRKQVRRIQITNMENDHESENVRLFVTDNRAVIVYEHSTHH